MVLLRLAGLLLCLLGPSLWMESNLSVCTCTPTAFPQATKAKLMLFFPQVFPNESLLKMAAVIAV